MSEYTKGKWEIDLIAYDKTGEIIIYHSDYDGLRTNICTILQTDTPVDEADANACLIAAAPELLKACKIAISQMAEHNPQYPAFESLKECPKGHKYECGACYNRRVVQAAIAKASNG